MGSLQNRSTFFKSFLNVQVGGDQELTGSILARDIPVIKTGTKCSVLGIQIFIAPAYSKVQYRGSTFRPFVRPSFRPSTIYVKVLTL